jgi:hypothetical protein
LGGFDGGFAVAVLNDNVASIVKKMLERDPEFEKSLLEKAKKQQDLVVMSYGKLPISA